MMSNTCPPLSFFLKVGPDAIFKLNRHGMISKTCSQSNWLEDVPQCHLKLNRHKCRVHKKIGSILRCQTVRVVKCVLCTCRSTQLANHFFVKLRDSTRVLATRCQRCQSGSFGSTVATNNLLKTREVALSRL